MHKFFLHAKIKHLIYKEESTTYTALFLRRAAQTLLAVLRDLKDGQLSMRAMSLVYTTLITLVPLLAISFSVLKGLGVHNQMETALYGMLEPLGPQEAGDITDKVLGFVDNVQVGVLGAIGIAILLYTVVSLMQKIESAFNFIWRVTQNRSFTKRFSDFLSVLLIAPLMLFVSAAITTALGKTQILDNITTHPLLEDLAGMAGFFVPYLLMTLGFMAIYMFMPNTRVKIPAAFIGGLFAALMWKIFGAVFTTVIAGSASYVAIYAAFATLILFMIWMYLSWYVVLIGANISFYVQNPRYLTVPRKALHISSHQLVQSGLGVIELIGKAHYSQNAKPLDEQALAKALNQPLFVLELSIKAFIRSGIIIRSDNAKGTLHPAQDFARIKMRRVMNALYTHGMNHKDIRNAPMTHNFMADVDKAHKIQYDMSVKKALVD